MVVTQTPFRVSLVGGGTDIRSYWQHETGAVVSFSIQKFMYVGVHARFNDNYRIAYSNIEVSNRIELIKHDLVRASLQSENIKDYLEITTISDIPSGTGLGSSSTLAVGLLKALKAYKKELIDSNELAEQACKLEIDMLGKPIGKQDQYAAALGGCNLLEFKPDDTVRSTKLRNIRCLNALAEHCFLIHTGDTRNADDILQEQSTTASNDILNKMRDQAYKMYELIEDNGSIANIAKMVDEGWQYKRSLTPSISNTKIDTIYNKVMSSGAMGCKLLGAGGGGFMLVIANPAIHKQIISKLDMDNKILQVSICNTGSTIAFKN